MPLGWLLEDADRVAMLRRYPPRYAQVVAHHVTLPRRSVDDASLPAPASATVVGRADDGAGVEALVVAIDGETMRPDGGRFHITWSLAAGRAPRESNDVIAARGWVSIDTGETVAVTPGRWD